MAKSLLPQAFWFRLCAPCPRVNEIPRDGRREGLLGLPATCSVPELSTLEHRASWASVRAAWNLQGLGIAILAQTPPGLAAQNADRPEGFADVNLWIDTRDTRDVSRATRFCHRFSVRLTLTRDRKNLDVAINQRPIARAVADAPICSPNLLRSHAELN